MPQPVSLISVVYQLHDALMLAKADVEKDGFKYGKQSVVNKALAEYDKWSGNKTNEPDMSKVTRIEIFDKNGHLYVNRHLKDVNISMQEGGKAMKIFCTTEILWF